MFTVNVKAPRGPSDPPTPASPAFVRRWLRYPGRNLQRLFTTHPDPVPFTAVPSHRHSVHTSRETKHQEPRQPEMKNRPTRTLEPVERSIRLLGRGHERTVPVFDPLGSASRSRPQRRLESHIPVTATRENRQGSRRRRPSSPLPHPETPPRSHRRLTPSCRLAFTAARHKRRHDAITRRARAAHTLTRSPERVATQRWEPPSSRR